MKFLLAYLLLLIITYLCNGELTLVWEEEFNGNKLDGKSWIKGGSTQECEKQFSKESKSCNSFSDRNIQVSNGTLKLNVIQENLYGEKFTGATIKSKKCFKNARVEIRAKKPIGRQLHAGLIMYAYKGECGLGEWYGEVDIAKLRNNTVIWRSLHFGEIGSPRSRDYLDDAQEDLNEYQVYGVEWNDTNFEWFINDRKLYGKLKLNGSIMQDESGDVQDLSKIKNPLNLPFDHSFNIILHVGVASFKAGSMNLPELSQGKIKNWMSPSLEVDYIRVYENRTPSNGISTIYLIIIPLVIILTITVVLLILVAYLWRRQRRKTEQVKMDVFYDDNFDGKADETYEDYSYPNEYDHSYEQVELPNAHKKQEYLEIN